MDDQAKAAGSRWIQPLVTEAAGGPWGRSKFSSGSNTADDDDDNDNDANNGKGGNGLSGVVWKTPTHNNAEQERKIDS